jgi:hypothetical protein
MREVSAMTADKLARSCVMVREEVISKGLCLQTREGEKRKT